MAQLDIGNTTASGYLYKGTPIKNLAANCPATWKVFKSTCPSYIGWDDLNMVEAQSLTDFYGNIITCWGKSIFNSSDPKPFFNNSKLLDLASPESVFFPFQGSALSAVGKFPAETDTIRINDSKESFVYNDTTYTLGSKFMYLQVVAAGGPGGRGYDIKNGGVAGGGGGGGGAFLAALLDISRIKQIDIKPVPTAVDDEGYYCGATMLGITNNNGSVITIKLENGQPGNDYVSSGSVLQDTYSGGGGGSVLKPEYNASDFGFYVLYEATGGSGAAGVRIGSDESPSRDGLKAETVTYIMTLFGDRSKQTMARIGGQGENITTNPGRNATGVAGGGGGGVCAVSDGISHNSSTYPTGAGGCGQSGWNGMDSSRYQYGGNARWYIDYKSKNTSSPSPDLPRPPGGNTEVEIR